MIALYASLSHPPGLLLGWMNLAGGTASGDLFWIKKAARSADYYTNGFTNTLAVVGSLWTNPPAHTVAVSLSDGQLPLTGGGLADLLAFNLSINKAAIGWLGWS